MKGIIIKFEILYFATFRKPSSTSLILTYSIPPFTTIRGMIANAIGLSQHDHSLQDKIKIGIRVLNPGYKNVEMAKILKLKESNTSNPKIYPSSPMFKEYLVQPKYEIYLGGKDEIMEEIDSLLNNLKRPLYLGQSDDLVDIQKSELLNIQVKTNEETNSIVEGIYQNCLIEKVPYKFFNDGDSYNIEYKLVSIPHNKIIRLSEFEVFQFGNNYVTLF